MSTELTGIIFRQSVTMALYMAMGYLLFRRGKITAEGSKSIAALLLWLVLPGVIINSFCVEFTPERLEQLGVSALLGAGALLLAMALARLIYGKSPVDNFAAAFSNAGFMGIPLVKACFGESAVFYLVAFVAFLNVMQWVYGIALLSRGKAQAGWKQLLFNPICAGLAVGLLLFFTGLGTRLPGIIRNTVSGIAALNGPLAMLVLGVYLAQTNPIAMLTKPGLYILSAVRLLLIPAATMLLLSPIPADTTLRLTILAAACAPVGSNVAVYAQLYGEDYPYACQTVAMSTLLSILTMPAVLSVGSWLFNR